MKISSFPSSPAGQVEITFRCSHHITDTAEIYRFTDLWRTCTFHPDI